MKKIIIALLIICPFSFTSCYRKPDNLEIITAITQTLATTDEQTAIGNPTYSVCKEHPDWYHELDATLMDYIVNKVDPQKIGTAEGYEIYFKYFIKTIDINPRSFCHYFGISKDKYKELYAYLGDREDSNMKDEADAALFFNIDELFGTQEQLNSKFTNEKFKSLTIKSEEIIPEGCTEHTYTYHTIHYTLIEYIGADKYSEFKDKYEGMEDFNIINFIKYYGIDRPTYEKICSTDGWSDEYGVFHNFLRPYNPDYLYGEEDKVKEYFYCHPIE